MKQSPRRGQWKKGGDRYQGAPPKRQPHRTHRTRKERTAKREIMARGLAGDLGLDGKLRVDLDPLYLSTAEKLIYGRGAEVYTPRGQTLGKVEVIVGTLDRPIAIVRLRSDSRRIATEMRGREVFLG